MACHYCQVPRTLYSRDMFMTTGEAAKHLGVSIGTVIRWYEADVLHGYVSPGGHHRILETSVEAVRRHPAGKNVTVITTSEVE